MKDASEEIADALREWSRKSSIELDIFAGLVGQCAEERDHEAGKFAANFLQELSNSVRQIPNLAWMTRAELRD